MVDVSTDDSLSEEDLDFLLDDSCSENQCEIIKKCIAFEDKRQQTDYSFSEKDSSNFLSQSNSDLTVITPCSYSSDCCSMQQAEHLNKNKKKRKSLLHKRSKGGCSPYCPKKTGMPLLEEAMGNLMIRSSTCSNSNHSMTILNRIASHRKNISFSNDQLRKIERENEILLKKIMSHANSRIRREPRPTPRRIRASAAINRNRAQYQISHENYILLRKIQDAKATQRY